MHYAELSDLLVQKTQPIGIRYAELYRILCSVLNEATAENRMDFSGPFARLTFLASHLQLPSEQRIRLNELRVRCQSLELYTEEELKVVFPFDVLAVVHLMEVTGKPKAPPELQRLLPHKKTKTIVTKAVRKDYLRVCVVDFDENYITAVCENAVNSKESAPNERECLHICYTDPNNRMGNWEYLNKLITKSNKQITTIPRPRILLRLFNFFCNGVISFFVFTAIEILPNSVSLPTLVTSASPCPLTTIVDS